MRYLHYLAIGFFCFAIGSVGSLILQTPAVAQSLQYLCDPESEDYDEEACAREMKKKMEAFECIMRAQTLAERKYGSLRRAPAGLVDYLANQCLEQAVPRELERRGQ
jgi:hypothetical protein